MPSFHPCARAPPANTMFTGRGTRGGTRGGRDQFNWEDVRGMDADRTHYLGASVKARKVQHPPTPRRFPPWQRSRRALRGLSARLRPRAGQEQREAWARAGGAKRTRWQTGHRCGKRASGRTQSLAHILRALTPLCVGGSTLWQCHRRETETMRRVPGCHGVVRRSPNGTWTLLEVAPRALFDSGTLWMFALATWLACVH